MKKLIVLLALLGAERAFAQCGSAGTPVKLYGITVCAPRMAPTFTGNVTIGNNVFSPATSEPTCNSDNRGVVVSVRGGAGAADTLRQCQKKSDNTYAWIGLAISGAGTGDLVAANNLSDIANATTARTNLGVEPAVSVGTFAEMGAATPATHDLWVLTDSLDGPGSCRAGGGTSTAVCKWSGAAWEASSGMIAGGSSGQVPFQTGAGKTGFSTGLSYNDTTKFLGLIGGVTVGQTGTATGEIRLNGTTSGTAVIKPADAAGTPTFTLPTASGTFITTASAPSAVISLFNSGTCSGYLKSDGSCDTPAGAGNVTGPASSTNDHIPQFSDTTGKALKDGLGVVTSVGSPGADTNIPTEAAVRAAIGAAGGGDFSGPASSTADNLVSFNGTGGKTGKDSGLSTANTSDAISKKHTQNTDTGTTSQTFQLQSGSSGPKLKNESGTLAVRNAADDAYAPIKASQVTAGDGTTAGEVVLPEVSSNGTEYISWLAPNAITSTLRLRLPNATPNGQVLNCAAPSGGISDCTWAPGGGTTVNVNGSSVSSPNFNATTPAAESGYRNVKFQVSGSSVSAEVDPFPAYSVAATGGASNAYVGTMSSGCPAAYVINEQYQFTADAANTGSATINLCSLGAKTIKKQQGQATLAANDIRANAQVLLMYDGTDMQMISQTGNAAGGGTIASTTSVLKGDNGGNAVAATPGTDYMTPSTAVQDAQLAAKYKLWECQPGMGDGLNAITAGTYLQSICWNKTGGNVTLSGFQCYSDNNGTSTMNVTNSAGTALLTGAVTCSSSAAAGTQSATVTLANNDYLKFTFVADGTTKQSTWIVVGSK